MQELNSIGGEFWMENNALICDLSYLSSLTAVGVEVGIMYNNSLTSLMGLNNITPESIINLTIKHNSLLSDCSVESICEYLVDPQGSVDISDNAPFCNTRQEVEDACLVLVEEAADDVQLKCSPNPIEQNGIINYYLEKNSLVSLNIMDFSGRQILTLENGFKLRGEHRAFVDFTVLPSGVYFCVLENDYKIQSTKIIVL